MAAGSRAVRPPREQGVQRLALAVLSCALNDACEDSHRGLHARHWLRQDSAGRAFWLTCAGVAERQLLRVLARLEAAGLGDAARQEWRRLGLARGHQDTDDSDMAGAA